MIEMPNHLHARLSEILANEMELVTAKRYWAVILGLEPKLDGDQWCVCYGPNIQEGVCGFGSSPMDAVIDFDRAWHEKVQP